MKVIRWIINFVCGSVAAITFFYFITSLTITVFILTGMFTVGEPMFIDLNTPSLLGLLKFQILSAAIISLCILARAKFGKKYDLRFLRAEQNG